jgi:hypothetical protein
MYGIICGTCKEYAEIPLLREACPKQDTPFMDSVETEAGVCVAEELCPTSAHGTFESLLPPLGANIPAGYVSRPLRIHQT